MFRLLLILVGLFGSVTAGPISAPAPGPYHAFCRVLWLIAIPCTEVSDTVAKQIKAMSPGVGCVGCHYMLVSATNTTVQANHTSSDGLQAENITFTLGPTMLSPGCKVSGESISLGFTSLLDDGLNYCNLYNLLSGSGLTLTPGFMEVTNEWACLGITQATCKK